MTTPIPPDEPTPAGGRPESDPAAPPTAPIGAAPAAAADSAAATPAAPPPLTQEPPPPGYAPGYTPGYTPGYPAAYPFAPRVREPWINPAKRATAAIVAGVTAIVLLGAGIAIGAAAVGDGHQGRDGMTRSGNGPGGYGQQVRGRGQGLPGRPRLPGINNGPGRLGPSGPPTNLPSTPASTTPTSTPS
jgi:hypothetical protein